MGFLRQSKITGQQMRAYYGGGIGKAGYAKLVAEEAKEQAKKSARKAKMYRAIGNASKKLKSYFK
jgi:hypothetical protein